MFSGKKIMKGFVISLSKEGGCPTQLLIKHCIITVLY